MAWRTDWAKALPQESFQQAADIQKKKMAQPIVQNMYNKMWFFKITETFMGFLIHIKPYKS